MLQGYSTNVSVGANSAVPFNNAPTTKGCTAVFGSPSTINLNKCGVYRVFVNASPSAATTLQLYRDGVAMAQAQSTGESALAFETYVHVDKNNTCNPCTSPVTIQVMNTNAATFSIVNITVSKLA